MTDTHEVTRLLKRWNDGDAESGQRLVALVYDELRRIAGGYLKGERSGHTLQPTALVHEAYFRLVDHQEIQWQDRSHFFAISAQVMRRILVDHARGRHAAKRGGKQSAIPLESMGEVAVSETTDLVALDDALAELARLDPTKAKLVELRFFGGLSIEETGEVLGVSRATVVRQWRLAKAWIHSHLTKQDGTD